MRTWFITGASRGLGLSIAKAALEAGDQVVATARNPAQVLESFPGPRHRLMAQALDVTDEGAAHVAVQAALQRFGRIDVLVNNAGYGQLGAFEEIPSDRVQTQFATNVFGVFNVTREILPVMRSQRSGRIITISSIAGITGFPGSSIYCATKHAVGGWSEALGKEVAPFGIKVTCVYPGRFRTDFLDPSSVQHGSMAIDDYAQISTERRRDLDTDNHRQIGDPAKLATIVLELAKAESPPAWFGAGSDAYQTFTAKAEALRQNAEDWQGLMRSTDHG